MTSYDDLIGPLRALADSIPDPIFVLDCEGRYVSVFGGASRQQYDSAEILVGKKMQDVLPEEKWKSFLEVVRRAIDTGTLQTCEYRLSSEEVKGTDNNGPTGEQWFQGRVYPIQRPGEPSSQAIWMAVNITEQKNLEKRLKRLTEVDDLTEVYNRRYFTEKLHSEFLTARRRHRPLSLISFDIDHFKKINDTYGHHAGDRALKLLADTVKSKLRKESTLARVGGEEFAIICPSSDAAEAYQLADRIRKLVAELEFEAGPFKIAMTISLGVTELQSCDDSIDPILSRADSALYKAKRTGRNRVSS